MNGHYRPSRARYLHQHVTYGPPVQQRLLAWLRDHVNAGIPRVWYRAVLGHDLHMAVWGELYAQHVHANERDPFTGELGWMENVGRVSCGKVTVAYRDFTVDQVIAESSIYGDYKYHEVGTSTQAEANTDTALITTTGISRVAGTQVEASAAVYRSVASIVADTSETWGEHGIFNASTGVTLMDRSLISPTVAVVNLDSVQFTYEITFSAEA